MRITVTLGYDGHILVDGDNHNGATFVPGLRTLTGARHRDGTLRAMTAAMLMEYLGIERAQLQKRYDQVVLDDDKGIFDPITAVDIDQNSHRIAGTIAVPVRTLMGVCALNSKK